jgi:hypothetical protein
MKREREGALGKQRICMEVFLDPKVKSLITIFS